LSRSGRRRALCGLDAGSSSQTTFGCKPYARLGMALHYREYARGARSDRNEDPEADDPAKHHGSYLVLTN
jgi:hypothetical protein